MDIKTFTTIVPKLPAQQAILLRGPTGVGKSANVKAIAESLGLPMIDVRTSVMDEGTMGGIPNLKSVDEHGVAHNSMYGWFIRACREPVVLFLDELNRAIIPVLQSAFQLVLDREMGNDREGNPYALHPETRVFAAGNFGSEYESEDLDPAMLRRFLVIDLEPTTDDWLDWAHGRIDSAIVEFIRNHPAELRVDPSTVDPGTIVPCPATWESLDRCLKSAEMAPSSWAGQSVPMGVHAIAKGLVGAAASISMCDFVKNMETHITADDVLDRWEAVAPRCADLEQHRRLALIEGLGEKFKEVDLNAKQAGNVAQFVEDVLTEEECVHIWTLLSQCGRIPNLQILHPLIGARATAALANVASVER